MSLPLTLEEIEFLESWANDRSESNSEGWSVAQRAAVVLRELMSQDLSKKALLGYLHQQMGIKPKSERGSSLLSNQHGGSGIPRAILRQP